MKIGDLVYDSALGLWGIIIDGKTVIPAASEAYRWYFTMPQAKWDFFLLYEDGGMNGSDTRDLEVIHEV